MLRPINHFAAFQKRFILMLFSETEENLSIECDLS